MPHPSNLPRRAADISPATVYLHEWHGEEDRPIIADQTATQPTQLGDLVAMAELRNGTWRLIYDGDNFRDLLLAETGSEGNRFAGRIIAIERRCSDIWISTYLNDVWHSSDGGKNWELNINAEGSDQATFIAYDASGRLWRLNDNITGSEAAVVLYKSNSGKGDDWEAVYLLDGSFFVGVAGSFPAGHGLACHPTDPNIIAFAAIDFGTEDGIDIAYCFVTTDGGSTVTQIQLPIQDFIEFGPEPWGIYDIIFTESGRLIVMFENFENEEPFENRFFADYTDDYEAFILNELLPEVRTGHFGFQGHLTTSGNLVFAAFTRDHASGFSPTGFDGLICHIAKSTDNGNSYEEFVRFTQPTNEIVDMPGYPQGLLYDIDTKLLYVFFSSFQFPEETTAEEAGYSGLFLQTVDEGGNKATATQLIEATGLENPFPLYITVTPQKGISSTDRVNRPRGRLAGNVSNLPGGEVLCH